MAVVVEVIKPTISQSDAPGNAVVVEVVRSSTTPIETVSTEAVVEVVKPGGTVVNVQFGEGLPSNPYEGQIFIDIS